MKQETDRQKKMNNAGAGSDRNRSGSASRAQSATSTSTAMWTTGQIESHLRSAVNGLTPDIFDRLDLSVPQDPVPRVITPIVPMDSMNSMNSEGSFELGAERTGRAGSAEWSSEKTAGKAHGNGKVLRFERYLRRSVATVATFLLLITAGGGVWQYHARNLRVDSIIGIDVNPSVELSINQRSQILSAEALNEDAKEILSDMDLKGVDLNVAVNAVIGSMVTHGYLDDTENAILVTVNNDSMSKASKLRSSVVGDIETTLKEHQVQAVVYDQQATPEDDEVSELAKEYGISYGKAYFLKELIAQNKNLSMEDMERFSTMTMEEIAEQINQESLALGEKAEQAQETDRTATAPTEETTGDVASTKESTEESGSEEEESRTAEAEPTQASQPVSVATSSTETTAESEDEENEEIVDDGVEIDYAEWEDDQIFVYFATFVKWKNPTVLIRDEDGNHYPAYVDDTSKDECVISAEGLEGGKTYTFVLGGLTPREGKHATTVTGTFEKPEIADDAMDDPDEDDLDDDEETNASSKSDKESETSQSEQSKGGEMSSSKNSDSEDRDGEDSNSKESKRAKESEGSDVSAKEETNQKSK